LNENNANKCAICGRPAWGDEAEREWVNRNTGERETIRARFCIYHHPDHEKKAEEFWNTFLANFNSERSEANPFGLLEREGDNLLHDFSQFIFPKFLESIKWEDRPFISANFFLAKFQGWANFSGVQFQGDAHFQWAQFQGEASFSGVKFQGGANFLDVEFQGKAYLLGAQFQGGAYFSGARFQGGADFWWARFQGGANFPDSEFQEEAHFSKANFQGKADFRRAQFHGKADFSEAQFHGKADFSWAKFQGGASFREVEFQGKVSFESLQFQEGADFTKAEFQERAYFSGVQFQGKAIFQGSQFQGWADFGWVKFREEASFLGVEFQGGAYFLGARFQGKANFSWAKFQGEAYCLLAEFQGGAHFLEVKFQGKASFREAKIFSEILFKDTFFSDLVDFRGAELSEHGDESEPTYGRLIFDGIEITDPAKLVLMGISNPDPEHCGIAFWLTRTPIVRGAEIRGTMLFDERGRMVVLEEYAERVLKEDKKGLENLPEEERRRREREIERRNRDLRLQSYRAVRLNLEDEGMFPEAGELYVREMSIKGDDKPLLRCFLLPWDLVKNFFKKMFKRSKIKNDKELGGCGYKVLLLAYRCLSKYGESWLRPLGWLLLVLILFSVVYMFTGFEGMEYSYSLFSKYGIISFQGLLRDFSWALIYSFKSLIPGFGQLSPRSTSAWTTALTVVEGVLGAVIITLLLLAIRRRFRR